MFPSNPDREESILFHCEEIDFELKDVALISTWLKKLIEHEDHKLFALNFIFCPDEYLHKKNLEYLGHDTLTDIITFPMSESPEIEGDIFISIERVSENARRFDDSFENELHRVMAHGVLHLCGYRDKTEMDSKKMRQKEREALRFLDNIRKESQQT